MSKCSKLLSVVIFFITAPVQASELLSCEKLTELNDAHVQLLVVGMSKDEVASIMGSSYCSEMKNPAKSQSFKVDSDVIEVLWYKSAHNETGLIPLLFKNGKYGGRKIGFITSPNSGS